MYSEIEEKIKRSNLKKGEENLIKDEWIKYAEEKLGFELPKSYKWFLKKFEFLDFGNGQNLKTIAPPEFREDATDDILYTFETEGRPKEKLTILELFDGDELYYFKIQNDKTNNEYPVFKMDNYAGHKALFADNFIGFLEKFI